MQFTRKSRGAVLALSICAFLAAALPAARAGGGAESDWGNDFLKDLQGIVQPVPMILEGRGPTKAAFMMFATGAEIRAPEETVRYLTQLRDIDHLPIHGIWIEAQHTRFSPAEIQNLVGMAAFAGFHTMIRVPEATRAEIQGYLGTGADGIIIPFTERREQVSEALMQTFFSAWRELGSGADTANFRQLKREQLDAVDARKVVAFMIESNAGVDAIEELVRVASYHCEKYGIPKSHVVFWVGAHDGRKDRERRMGGSDARIEAWWKDSVRKVSEVVNAAGFSMGGHVNRLEPMIGMVEQHGFKAFAIPGYADSIGNPDADTTGGMFKRATPEQRARLVREAELSDPELMRLVTRMARLERRFLDCKAPLQSIVRAPEDVPLAFPEEEPGPAPEQEKGAKPRSG